MLGRPGGGDVAAAGARGGRDRGRACRDRAAGPTPAVVELRERALEALGVDDVRRALRPLPAALLLLVADRDLGAVRRPQGPDLLADPARRPTRSPSSLYTDRSLLWSSFLVTAAGGAARDLVAAVAVGSVLAVAIHFSPTLRRATYPLMVASQAVPVAVFAPVLAFWLGFGILPKLVVVALVSFFSIVVTTLAGLDAVDPDLLKLMRTFDASRLRDVPARRAARPRCRACSPGAKIAVAVSVIGAVFAE